MMPVVRISDHTWERLQQHARPLVDTPDSVISAALDALDTAVGKTKPKGALTKLIEDSRQRKNEITPQKEFRPILLEGLSLMGGRAQVPQIRDALQTRVKSLLKPGDTELVSSGDVRWWNAVCWERADLVREGLLRSDSPRGVWELTDRGKLEAKKL